MEDVTEKATALTTAVINTFGEMAFIDVQPAAEEQQALPSGQSFKIPFKKPREGELHLYLPLEAKQFIVENILAQEWEELSPVEIDDCLLELLNVLAGAFLRNLCGEDSEIRLLLPEISFDTDEQPEPPAVSLMQHYDAEGIPFAVAVVI